MLHPLARIKPERRGYYFYPLLIGTVLIMAIMNYVGLPLNTVAAPSGIVSFEIAATPERAQQMLDSWNTNARTRAAFIQGLDFLFPWVYSSALALGCSMAGDVLRSRKLPLAGLGNALAWGQWAAAGFDYIENVALVILLFGTAASPWPQIAALCAGIKFVLIFLGLAYAFYGLAMRLVKIK
jgi:hypothetical protein